MQTSKRSIKEGEDDNIIIRPSNQKELASLYGIPVRTFRRYLKPFLSELGKKIGQLYTVKQIKKIIELLGPPSGKVRS